MKQRLFLFAVAVTLSVSACKEDAGKESQTKSTAKAEASAPAAAFPEQGPCYKYMHCQADSEINYSGISKSECASKGGKSWKGERSGCTEL